MKVIAHTLIERDNIKLGTLFGGAFRCVASPVSYHNVLAHTWGTLAWGQNEYSAHMQLCAGTVKSIRNGNLNTYGPSSKYNPIARWRAHRMTSNDPKYKLKQIGKCSLQLCCKIKLIDGNQDALNQLDVLLLHEMLHTRMTDLEDVSAL
jgi:hypothetical protein